MNTLRKIWLWLKTYWYIPLLLVAVLIFAILFAGKKNPAMDLLKKKNKAYNEEKKKLEDLERKQNNAEDNIERDYQRKLEDAKKTEELKQKLLRKKKEEKLKKILKDDKKELHEDFATRFNLNHRKEGEDA